MRAPHRLYNRTDREAALVILQDGRTDTSHTHTHFDVDFTFLFYFDNKSTTFNIILWESPHTIHIQSERTAYRTFFVWASENRVGKDIINYYRIRLMCVCVCAPLPYMQQHMKRNVCRIHSLVVRLWRFVFASLTIHAVLHTLIRTYECWEFSVTGLTYAATAHIHMWTNEWSEEKCQFLIYVLRTWIWVNKRGRSGKRMKWRKKDLFFFGRNDKLNWIIY